MNVTAALAPIEHSDYTTIPADGASNVIGSATEFESPSHKVRANDITFDVCYAHQAERSGTKESDTVNFSDGTNKELGVILKKNSRKQVMLLQGGGRMHVHKGVQEKKGREPRLNTNPGTEMRWNSRTDKTVRGNMIMGDVSNTLGVLLVPDGEDYSILTRTEKASRNTNGITYTDHDETFMRYYTGATRPAKVLSKIFQDKRNTSTHVLYFFH